MLSDPRSIAFVVECIHPPTQHQQADLQTVFSEQSKIPALGYANFNTNPTGAQMTTVHGPASVPGSTSHSVLAFAADRFQLKEEWPQVGLDDFVNRALAAAELSLEKLQIPAILAVQCVVRCLVSVQGCPDSRTFLDQVFFGLDDVDCDALGREPNLLGLRLAFPANEGDPSVHNVRIESFNSDPRSLFLEETSVWQRPIRTDNFGQLEESIRESYSFLTNEVVDFLKGRIDD